MSRRTPITRDALTRRVEKINDMMAVFETGDCYELDGAYGGWRLEVIRLNGNVSDVLGTGYVSKRQLFEAMEHFITGMTEVSAANAALIERTLLDAQSET